MSILLAIFYTISVQYYRGGWWKLLLPLVILTLLLDIIANYTELALLTLDFPRKEEYTFSKRLSRLQHNNDWRGTIASWIIPFLNYFDPSKKHIS